MQQGFTRKPRVLLVGAGAVGQVLGLHFQDGGATVDYLVKPKYERKTREGMVLHRYTLAGATRKPRTLVPDTVYSSPEKCAGNLFDQVVICVSAPALRGDWLPTLAPFTGKAAIVSMTPGVEDRRHLERFFAAERVVTGMIGFIAYQCPLEGEDLFPSGVAYLLPPFSPCLFEGEAALKPVEILQRGGLSSAHREDARQQLLTSMSILVPTVVGLETEGWSIDRFRRSETLELVIQASEEIAQVFESLYGVQRSTGQGILMKPWWFRTLAGVAKSMSPIPLEAYLKYHFSKVRPQTVENMHSFLEAGAQAGRKMPQTRRLAESWQQAYAA